MSTISELSKVCAEQNPNDAGQPPMNFDEQRQHHSRISVVSKTGRKASQFAFVVRHGRTDNRSPSRHPSRNRIHQEVGEMPLRQPIPRRRRQQPHLIRTPRSISLLNHNQLIQKPSRIVTRLYGIPKAVLRRQAPSVC